MALNSEKNLLSIRAKESDDWLDITALAIMAFGDEDLSNEDSGRTLDGKMHNNVITSKEYYDLDFIDLNWNEISKIMKIVRGKSKIQFKYPSPLYPDQLTTSWFYCQGRAGSCKMAHKKLNGKVEVIWTGLSFRLAQI